ncbi:MAG: DUF423 domain-containing protein [Rhodospirillum sp.]|nr:DUF423 domain-containing protein [Rhodospirillum sp.]MCF8490816.1 DUF423 domain-containing protein [Rhodospirillum sp.]MCF8501697.1 DUF423 domain-containing protein [Rhodospirillum sp.]
MPLGVWLALAGVNGFLSVAMGAFAAHGLEAMGDPHAVALVEKAARYQMYGVIGFVVAAWAKGQGGLGLLADILGCLQLIGILLFCGSLVLIALLRVPVAFLAPFGGMAMLVGWIVVAWMGIRSVRRGGV